ncbi:type II secretion system protein GspM [Halochromatium glycolicum]|uniref:General secretion pathway protein GspM n=1 Tax=Halochromatium glycolicum TaxID=85075 RepID=A0AAJ0XAQ0_9GAMM|nr:type II secretion system protein GspM [Halochromatium glycolicum]MBK1705573.1 general secretion pathway protein GspM [Halochromatium glycolicum]
MSPSESAAPTHCLIAWALLLLLPLTLVAAIGLPWWGELDDLSRRIADDRDQIQRYQRVVATLPVLREELARERTNDDFKAFSFDEATPALAGAALQRRVQEMIRAVDARPISAQILPTQEADSPPRVRLRVQIQAQTDQLLDLLFRLEEARPFLFVDQMSIRASTRRVRRVTRGRSRGAPSATPEDQLTVRLDIFGYSLGSAS